MIRKLLNGLKHKSLKHSIDLLLRPDTYIVGYWSRSSKTKNNWGDMLNEYLIEELSGKKVLHKSEVIKKTSVETFAVVGSVLDRNRINNLNVWGSGMLSSESPIYILPEKIYAVRGPKTRARLLELNVECPPVYGDPALLFPKYYHPDIPKKYELGIIPHYADKHNRNLERLKNADTLILDIEAGLFEFPKQMLACKRIASSSLHGLILADAYDIPNVRVRFSDKIKGGDFKYEDYFLSVERTNKQVVDVNENTTTKDIKNAIVNDPITIDLQKLIEACPFQKR